MWEKKLHSVDYRVEENKFCPKKGGNKEENVTRYNEQ